MEGTPLVSLIIEMGTREITGCISIEDSMQPILEEARRTFSDAEFEIFFVGSNLSSIPELACNCRCLNFPTTGYYGWKNAGAKVSRGKYLVFWDSDTRPIEGYLSRAFNTLEENPSLS